MPELEPRTPDWVKDAVFYQIFPDRFARSERVPKAGNLEAWDAAPTPHGYKGGDLIGVAEHLEHIAGLGANAIYFCPVFQSASNHRYHTHDYEKVDPMLGGESALRELIDAAHDRGIKVVLDGVFNHASRGFFQFNDILENGSQSAYVDWFHIEAYPLRAYHGKEPTNYKAWWGMPALPKFNTDTPAVREFLWGIAEQWIRFGADGWRLDVANEIDDDAFWQEFRRRVRAVNPEAYIVGEIWEEAQRWLRGDQFDATMNYPFTRLALGFFGRSTLDRATIAPSGLGTLETLDAPEMARRLDRLLALYPWEVTLVQMNLLDSHDTPRFVTSVSGDTSAFRLATVFQMAFPGAPCVYYGDEIGLQGRHDPDNRRGMPWDEKSWDRGNLEFMRRAIAARHDLLALRRGRYRTLFADGMTLVFERYLEATAGERVLVALNADAQPRALSLPTATGATYRDRIGGQSYTARGAVIELTVPARTGMILAP